ncbi:MAG TPA: TIM44-like domain-containing protein [Acetobacteraceae bacterium]|nr:TIM44-like domain-containing protein [Acetobacteraceae bacterium]
MRSSALLAAIAALSLALAPGLADARAGAGGSFGSRGGFTYSAPPATRTAPNSAQPMQRSVTPSAPSPSYGSNYATPGYRPGFGFGGFGSGLLGGLLGVGLGSMLFGHGFGFGGFFGLFGFLFRVLLIVLIVRWLFRWFRGNGPAFAGGAGWFSRNSFGMGGARPMPMGGSGGAPAAAPPLAISPGDYQDFEHTLQWVQAAWSRHDLEALRALTTPEMLGYFAEQLADQASRGVRNTVTDVRLLQGDLAQSWHENGRDYATVAMRFSMIDVTRDGSGSVVDGSPTEHVTATELWTFVRAAGGRWILSAIQQAR